MPLPSPAPIINFSPMTVDATAHNLPMQAKEHKGVNVFESHTATSESVEAETMYFPSFDQDTPSMGSVCLTRVVII